MASSPCWAVRPPSRQGVVCEDLASAVQLAGSLRLSVRFQKDESFQELGVQGLYNVVSIWSPKSIVNMVLVSRILLWLVGEFL